ncbi:MAG: DNA methyltransferase, partial [Gordonibacter sp.]|uniref:DNA methyltransferase n=1 Tax=Gordonibacter sp. TaxID=1968902 RepID=UPI002FC5C1F8
GIQHPFTGEIMYPPTSSCWRVGQSGLLDILNKWAPFELRDLNDRGKRAAVCGISEAEVRDNVMGIALAVPLEQARALAQKRYDQGCWPLMYFTGKGSGGMRRKRYLDESQGRVATNLWGYEEVGHTDEAKKQLKALFDGNAPFDTPKPVRLMRRILDIASDEDSIVLDFFSGSASMGEAVVAKNAEDGGNRNFILVQLPEKASGEWDTLCDIGEERIRRAGAKIAAEIEEENKQLKLGEEPKPIPDIGFRVLKLDDSGINNPDEMTLVDNVVKDDRTDEDIIFEMMLKWGLELTLPVEPMEAAGYPCYSVASDELICCMSEGLTIEALQAIADREPRRVFMLDSILTDTLKLNAVQIFKHASDKSGLEIELRTV